MPGITDEIKEKIDIVEFISGYVQLRKAGRNFVGFCPFHSNTRTPAFTVFPDTQSYHCFGCKASGTVFDFLIQREGLEFKDALEQLAKRAGVHLRERTVEDDQQDQLRTRLLEINAAAAAFFHHILLKSQRGELARAYVSKRAIDTPTIEAFQLGYSVDDWSALLGYLVDRKGFEPEEVEAAGLAIKRDDGGYYDRFRGRLMFPIRNAKGEVIAFGGRALGDAQPKYMNSPQTALFDKSRVLYGMDLARDSIRNQDAAVIVEGYVDVIIAHQYGFKNVVAPLGTALTSEHATVLKKVAKRIYLALDGDPAGVRATLKGLQTLQENLDSHFVPVPTAQGMIHWERELDAEVRVIALPEGKDPDEVIQSNPADWRALVEAARPVMDYYITALTSDLDLQSGKGKAEAVNRLAPLVAHVVNPVEQAHHIQQIARLVEVDEQIVRRAMPAQSRPASTAGAGRTHSAAVKRSEPAASLTTQRTQEDHLLGWLLHYASARDAVQEKIQRDLAAFPLVQYLINDSLLDLFEQAENRAIWSSWAVRPSDVEPIQWAEMLEEPLREQALRILQLKLPETQAYRYVNDALECATILQQSLARRWKDRMKQQATHAEDDTARAEALERLTQLVEYIGIISAPRRSSTYADLHSLHAV